MQTSRRATGVRRIDSSVTAFPCINNPGPIQVLDNAYGSIPCFQLLAVSCCCALSVKTLDIASGTYTTLWTLAKSQWGITAINANDISPIDLKAYGVVKIDSMRYLARFDEANIEYLGFIANSNLNAGVFDNDGDFFARDGKRMHKIKRPDLLQGYTTHSSATADFSAVWMTWTQDPNCNDYASLNYDLTGTGSKQKWLVGLGAGNQAKLNLINTECECRYLLDVSGYVPSSSSFGAAWTYTDGENIEHVYFASNDASVGIFELVASSVDIQALTCEIKRLGIPTANTANNDGMSCRSLLTTPFPM